MSSLDLQKYKEELMATYLHTFAYDKNNEKQTAEVKKTIEAARAPCAVDDVVAYLANQAAFGKNKNSFRGYALFTKDSYYGVDVYESPVTCCLSDVKEVASVKATKKSVFSTLVGQLFENGQCEIICSDGKRLRLATSVAEKLKGIAVINSLQNSDDSSYRQFVINKATYVFGEIAEGALSDDEVKEVKKLFPSGAASFIRYSCKLKRLTLDGAYYEIAIKDKEIKSSEHPDALYTEAEWEQAVNKYVSSAQIRKLYQDNILRNLGLKYDLDQIFFDANVKITIGTRLSEAAEVAQGAFEKMQDITEERIIQAMKDYEKEHKQQ